MRIQELEQLVGSDRATIRFYEKEGLINPRRSENGYRDYSAEDAEELKKILFLRELGITIETIRHLQQGSVSLDDVMSGQENVLRSRAQFMQQAERVCHQLKQDRISYRELETEQYRPLLYTPVQPTALPGKTVFRERIQREIHPWRRLFARYFDYNLTNALVLFLTIVILRWRPVSDFLLHFLNYVSWWIMLPLEAALLHFFGTTPGKWLMGIRVEDQDGGRLSVSYALERSFGAFGKGLGYMIPGYSIYRLWKSYGEELDGDGGSWNKGFELAYPKWNWYRKVMVPVGIIAAASMIAFSAADSVMPKFRGNRLEISEFAKNYNTYNSIYYYGYESPLNSDGTFARDGIMFEFSLDNGESVVYEPYGEFQYETENGKITAITLDHSWYDHGWTILSGESQPEHTAAQWMESYCELAMIATAAAQDHMTPEKIDEFVALMKQQQELPADQGVSWSYENLDITWTVNAALYYQPENSNFSPVYHISMQMRIEIG